MTANDTGNLPCLNPHSAADRVAGRVELLRWVDAGDVRYDADTDRYVLHGGRGRPANVTGKVLELLAEYLVELVGYTGIRLTDTGRDWLAEHVGDPT